jgi:hypothetical protein
MMPMFEFALVAAAAPSHADQWKLDRVHAGFGDVRGRSGRARCLHALRRARGHANIQSAAVDENPRLQPGFVEQEGVLTDGRRSGSAAAAARRAGRPGRSRRGHLAGQQFERGLVAVRRGEP